MEYYWRYAAWILLQGAVSIFLAVRQKKAGAGKGWLWTMILGILGVLVGIYSIAAEMDGGKK